uniref:Protein FRA10AC1 homolog n=1 Tax=Heterorhabditis bacteriophora TaxID=37862 RepID=A0A1I7XU11_HETBA
METIKRNPDLNVDDLQSEFDYQSEVERKKRRRTDFLEKEYLGEEKPGRDEAKQWFQEEHGRVHRQMSRLMAMDAYSRHKEMINLYYLSYPGATKLLQIDTSNDRTDHDVLRDNHKFLWSEKEEAAASSNWETRMAKKYYDKLFKEAGVRKNALVKLRLCCQCSEMLNYGSQKKKVEKKKRKRWITDEERKEINSSLKESKVSNANNERTYFYEFNCIILLLRLCFHIIEEESTSSKATSSVEDVWIEPVQEITRTVDEDIDDFLNDLFD